MSGIRMQTAIIIFISLFFISCSGSQTKLKYNDNGNELDAGMNSLSEQIVQSLTANKKKKIAVIEFSDLNGRIPYLGRFISEDLTTRLFLTKRFDVVERNLLKKVYKELKLSQSGVISASSIKKVGQILGVDAIATGTIADLGNRVRINARIIATESASLLSVALVTVKKDKQLQAMLSTQGKQDAAIMSNEGSEADSTDKSTGKGVATSQSDDSSYVGKGAVGLPKATYKRGEPIRVIYKNLPPYAKNWITVVPEYMADNSYKEWHYTHGKSNGVMWFKGLSPGDYQVRVYYNWSAGGYKVRHRLNFSVK